MSVLAVVIGRAGSRGLPGKNAKMLAGRPMICHTIQHAHDAECIERVIVSTDGHAIADAARLMGAEVIMRPAELATDAAPVDATVRHALETAKAAHDIVVILYANVPVRPADLIDRAVQTLIDTGADSVQSYCDVGKHHPWWMVRLENDGRVEPHHPNAVHRRQDLPRLLIPDGGVIAVRRESLFAEVGGPHDFLGEDRRGIETGPGEVVDVDTPLELAVAEAMLNTAACGLA
jgi:CMP-N,N'-diacetyllegionaminic acid synthase